MPMSREHAWKVLEYITVQYHLYSSVTELVLTLEGCIQQYTRF